MNSESRWDCPACGNVNGASVKSCSRCGRNRVLGVWSAPFVPPVSGPADEVSGFAGCRWGLHGVFSFLGGTVLVPATAFLALVGPVFGIVMLVVHMAVLVKAFRSRNLALGIGWVSGVFVSVAIVYFLIVAFRMGGY